MIERAAHVLALLLAAGVPTGCMFLDVKRQQERMEEACLITGSVSAALADPRPIVVLLRSAPGAAAVVPGTDWQIVDHFVLEGPGRWTFATGPGRYAVAAFDDRSADLRYQPGEPYAGVETPLDCTPGASIEGLALSIPAQAHDPFRHSLDIAALQARSAREQPQRTLGQLTVVGERASLADPRFSQANAEAALWRPLDFLLNRWAGVYFVEPYDPRRMPVLFVHGINGTPASFEHLLHALDRTRFQAWLYYYPSGLSLHAIADHLDQTMAKLELRHGVRRFAVVAHSMGGLVSRGFLLRHAAAGRASRIPLFVSISTPWGGHEAAETGVSASPVVVEVWRDMVPGSPYQREIFLRSLPQGTEHHLLFTFRRDAWSAGESDDQSVTLASQLVPQAQRDAARLYGFDDTHTGVLRNPEASALVDALLRRLP